MLKRTVTIGLSALLLSQLGFAADALGLAGTYKCSGYDMHDGGYQNAIATLTVDKKDSDFAHQHGAYHVKLVETDGTKYTGEAAANGNIMAIYFENTSPSAPTDRGVGVATVTHDKDTNGKVTTTFHKFYYEPNYQGGGNGSETCIKIK